MEKESHKTKNICIHQECDLRPKTCLFVAFF